MRAFCVLGGKYGLWALAILAGWLSPVVGFGQTWISTSSTDWHTPGNWSGGNVPNTNTETALFSTADLANPSITSNLTIRGMVVSAGDYTLSGSTGVFTINANTGFGTYSIEVLGEGTSLVINRNITTTNTAADITAHVNAAPNSTLTFAAGNTWTANHGIAFADLDVTPSGTFNFNGALNLNDNYFQGFNAFADPSTPAAVINFNPSSVTAVAGSQIQHVGGPGRFNLLTDFTASRLVMGNNAFFPTNGSVSEMYLVTNGMSMSRDLSIELANSSIGGGGLVTYRYGVDIADSGAATHAGSISLGTGGLSGENYKLALDAQADDTFTVTGRITNTLGGLRPGVSQFLAKTGSGMLRIEGAAANNWVGRFDIEQGRVVLNKAAAGTDAIPNTLITLDSGASLELGKAEQINNAAHLRFNGGTFRTGGFVEQVGQFSLLQASTLDFESGSSILTFAQFLSGSGLLTIDNWSGSLAGGGTDQLIFTNLTGLSPYLSSIHFTGYAPGAQLIGNEVVPLSAVPEPSAAFLLLACLAVGCFWKWSRRITISPAV